MKAIQIHEHGDLDQLRFHDLPDPEAGPGQVLVRVKACSLNHLDLWVRQGIPGMQIPLPRIPGSDVSGVVEQIGDGVTRFSEEDQVVVAPGLSCGACAPCSSGSDNQCRSYRLLGLLVDGGCADRIAVPERNLFLKPPKLTFPEAAAVPLVFMTAWNMLVNRADVQAGETALIHAGGSGLGSAAIQIAKMLHVRVLTTVGSTRKVALAEELGADAVINYEETDFAQEVLRLTDRRGVDVVIEHIGPSVFERSLLCMARNGRLVTCGATTGPNAAFDLRHLFSRQLSIVGSYMGSLGDLSECLDRLDQGRLRPVVDQVYPFEDIQNAHRYVQERRNFGKVVLSME